jgi:hypothetical protein
MALEEKDLFGFGFSMYGLSCSLASPWKIHPLKQKSITA